MKIYSSILFFASYLLSNVCAISVGHKALILTTVGDEGSLAAQYTLDSYGMPYDTITLTNAGISGLLPLESATDSGKYFLIIFTTDTLAVNTATGFVPALTSAQFDQLAQYQIKYGVRQVTLNAFPNEQKHYAKLAVANAGCCSTGEQNIAFTSSSPLAAAGILSTATLSTVGLYHYPSTILNSALVQSIVTFKGGLQAAFPTDTVGAIIIKHPTGREEMVFFIAFGWWSPTSLILGHMWFAWGTRGIYQGSRQLYMNTQIDDVFLETEAPLMPGQTVETLYRSTTSDFENIRLWMKDINARMGPGSNYKVELAFNGNGIIARANPDVALDIDTEGYVALDYKKTPGTGENRWPTPIPTDATLGLSWMLCYKDPLFTYFTNFFNLRQYDYFWLSHTFTHENLNEATSYDTTAELTTNAKIAGAGLLGMINQPYFSKKSLVTPQISGVFNADALKSIAAFGITSIVGDTSRSNLLSPYGNWFPFKTTLNSSNYDGFTIITRSPTEIYYHCSTPEQNQYIYNTIYSAQLGTSTFYEILEREANRVLFKLLSLHPDGYMFHQANLRKPTVNYKISTSTISGPFSLFQRWVETVVFKLSQYVSWPMISLKQDDMAIVFENRLKRKNCGIDANLVYDVTGVNVTGLTITSTGTCELPISVPDGVVKDVPGGVYTSRARLPSMVTVPMSPGKIVTVKLSSPVKVK
ncbi:hypothetical protein HK098_007854 [Nowakowskiella sp. JEL0407]|nr:hypothetical protein HK098_007854 [Nowakowskiella sp. JEL0407]